MATILTNGTGGGNWADTATWAGGVVPVYPNVASVVLGDTIDQVPAGQECIVNAGTITTNYGTVVTNSATGTVVYNYATVTTNAGAVTFIMSLVAIAGATSIHPQAFTVEQQDVFDDVAYRFNSVTVQGSRQEDSSALPDYIAGAIVGHDDHFGVWGIPGKSISDM